MLDANDPAFPALYPSTPMIDANDPQFTARYPYGATVRDRWGRQIPNVIVCNPERGEVIRYDGTWLTKQWLRLVCPIRVAVVTRHTFNWVSPSGGLLRIHGFWPAPLTIEGNRPAGAGTPGPSLKIKRIIAALFEHDPSALEGETIRSPRE